jgi:hypothetical protein
MIGSLWSNTRGRVRVLGSRTDRIVTASTLAALARCGVREFCHQYTRARVRHRLRAFCRAAAALGGPVILQHHKWGDHVSG